MKEGGKKLVSPNTSFLKEVEAANGESIASCFQCKKCTSGCPVAFAMEVGPDRLIHMIHLGMKDEVLKSNTIWVCASCEACSTRCPNDIDIAKTMDTLRQMCIREGRKPKESQVVAFHGLFLDSFKRHGRIYELEMLGKYKMKTGDYTKDIRLGWEMFRRGKIRLFPHRIHGRAELQRIFEKTKESRSA